MKTISLQPISSISLDVYDVVEYPGHMEYNVYADFLNKYSQLTPWVQALLGLGMCAVMLGVAYFIKETIAVVMQPFQGDRIPKIAKPAWRDKYYRDEKAQ